VAGTWVVASASITVASDGSLTGATSGTSFGTCTLAGSITLAEPATAKNLFLWSVVASGGSACKLEQGSPYKGFSAIVFHAAGNSVAQGYYRYVRFHGRTALDSTLSGDLKKQQ
jgi:hypothetical protein